MNFLKFNSKKKINYILWLSIVSFISLFIGVTGTAYADSYTYMNPPIEPTQKIQYKNQDLKASDGNVASEGLSSDGTQYTYYNGYIPDSVKDGAEYWNDDINKITSVNFVNSTASGNELVGLCANLPNLRSVDLSGLNTSNATNLNDMFSNDPNLQYINFDNFNTSKAQSMVNMFSGDSSLTNLDLSNFNTSNVQDMTAMFFNDRNLQYLDLDNFDTRDTDMSSMFVNDKGLSQLTLGPNTIINNGGNTSWSNSHLPSIWANSDNNIVNLTANDPQIPGTYYALRKTSRIVQVPVYIDGNYDGTTNVNVDDALVSDRVYLTRDMAPYMNEYAVIPRGYITIYPNDDVVNGSFDYLSGATERPVNINVNVNGNDGYGITLDVCGRIGTNVPVSDLIHEMSHYVGNTYYSNITASGYISIGQNNDVANGQFYYNN